MQKLHCIFYYTFNKSKENDKERMEIKTLSKLKNEKQKIIKTEPYVKMPLSVSK